MHPESADEETDGTSASKPSTTRIAHASVALAALVAVVTGIGALAVATPPPESAAAAGTSIAVEQEQEQADDIELPDSPTAGFSEEAARFAEGASDVVGLAASAYEATTPEELLKIRRDAREALIRAAIEAGIDVDLSRLDDEQLAALDQFVWPIANPVLTDQFGARGGKHMGMDIAAAGGTPITAAAPGIVVLSSESHYGYGVAVIIQHINGVQTLYGHMTYGSRVVEAGDWVEAGDPIGLVGNTGHSFGNHLHFEVRVKGVPVDPRIYLSGAGEPEKVRPWSPDPTVPAPSQTPAPQPTQAPEEPKPSAPAPTTPPSTQKPTTPTPTPTQPATPPPTPPATPTPTPAPTQPSTPSPAPTEPAEPTPTAPVPSEPTPSEPAPSIPPPAPTAPATEPPSSPPASQTPQPTETAATA